MQDSVVIVAFSVACYENSPVVPSEQCSLLGKPESCCDYLHQARNINFNLFSVFLSDVLLYHFSL